MEDTDVVFVKCTRDVSGSTESLSGKVVKVRPALVREVLISLLASSKAYEGIEFDPHAMDSINPGTDGLYEDAEVEDDGDDGGTQSSACDCGEDDGEPNSADGAEEENRDDFNSGGYHGGAGAGAEEENRDDFNSGDYHGGAGADTTDTFVDLEDGNMAEDINAIFDYDDLQPRFTLESAVNMIDNDSDIIVKIFPEHFRAFV